MGNKYSGLQIGIHWLVFLLVIVAYSAMEFRGFFPRSYRPLFNMVHVSCGITILTLMVARLLVRLKYPAPPIVPKPKPMMIGMAHLGHLVIYLLFIVLPIIGLVMMYNRGNPWIAFGIVMPHAAEANFDLVDMLKSWHVTLANLGYFVIGLHAFPLLHKLSEQYSFVCVLRADRLPGPDKSLLPVQRPKPWKGPIPIYKPVHYGTS